MILIFMIKIKYLVKAFTLMLLMSTYNAEELLLKQFIVHLETGKEWNSNLSPTEQKEFKNHSENMKLLREKGIIKLGARYGEFGLLIIESESKSSAIKILEADPGIKAGIFKFRIEPISIFYNWKN